MIKAVIFDIDGTLTPGISWLDLTRDLGAGVEDHKKIYVKYQAGNIDYPESKRQLLALWQATGNANHKFITKIFDRRPIRTSAKPFIRRLRNEGYLVCLITGSVDLFAEVTAGRLGVDYWYANTTLEFDDNGDLADYDYDLNQSSKKVEQLEYFCAKHRLEPDECAAVGDGDNDLGLFRATRHGILLEAEGQSPELRDAAWHETQHLADVLHLIQ